MAYVGIDVHKRETQICVLADDGAALVEKRVRTEAETGTSAAYAGLATAPVGNRPAQRISAEALLGDTLTGGERGRRMQVEAVDPRVQTLGTWLSRLGAEDLEDPLFALLGELAPRSPRHESARTPGHALAEPVHLLRRRLRRGPAEGPRLYPG